MRLLTPIEAVFKLLGILPKVLARHPNVSAVDPGFQDAPVVSLPGADQFSHVQATFPKEATAVTSALKKGQKVTVICAKLTEVIGSPMLNECSLK